MTKTLINEHSEKQREEQQQIHDEAKENLKHVNAEYKKPQEGLEARVEGLVTQ